MHAQSYFQPLLAAPSRLVSLLTPKRPVLPPRYRGSSCAEPAEEEAESYPSDFRVAQTVIVTLTKGKRKAVYSAYFEDPFGLPQVTVQGDANHFRRANGAPLSLDRLTLESIATEAVLQAAESHAGISILSLRGLHRWE